TVRKDPDPRAIRARTAELASGSSKKRVDRGAHLILGCDLLDRLVTAQSLKRDLRFKRVRKISALSHSRIPSNQWDTPYQPARISGTTSL
ncbi:hypothetical protein, partial [Roseibium denhamense]